MKKPSENKTLHDVLRKFTPNDDGILIRWDRSTGEYAVSFHGRPMSFSSINNLLTDIIKEMKKNTDDEGVVRASKGTDSKEKEDNTTPNWTPPWFKGS